MRMLDLFAGRLGWARAFAARGWECVAIDLTVPPQIPDGITFIQGDVMQLGWLPGEGLVICGASGMIPLGLFDFICASSPCEQFSVHGMKHFHPNPPYPEMGLKLFNHTRAMCEASGVPYVMENVRSAQKFVGPAVTHCGSFHLWGNGIPAILPQGIKKGMRLATGGIEGMNLPGSKKFRDMTPEQKRAVRKTDPMLSAASVSAASVSAASVSAASVSAASVSAASVSAASVSAASVSAARKEFTAKAATIPAELANAVVDYAERILEQARTA